MKIISADIEANALAEDLIDHSSLPYKLKDAARLWVLSLREHGTGIVHRKEKEEITREWVKSILKDCDILIFHNGLKFDLPILSLFGVIDYNIGDFETESTVFGHPCKIVDTLVQSRVLMPDRVGGHSLKALGSRLGEFKDDYRQQCIDAGYITKDAPKGAEFWKWNPLMGPYCDQDTLVTEKIYDSQEKEIEKYPKWRNPLRMEHLLADYGFRRETYGFGFDKEKAIKVLEEFLKEIHELKGRIEPLLPPKHLNQTQRNLYSLPKTQFKKDGMPSSHLVNFCKKHEVELQREEATQTYFFEYNGKRFNLPYNEPILESLPATVDDYDHIKMYLLELGWVPTEWKMRDVCTNEKKKELPYPKKVEVIRRYVKQTLEGKYKEQRLAQLNATESSLYGILEERIKEKKRVLVPTSPMIKVGVEKEICRNLTKLGEKVAFVKDFSLYTTLKHRANSIASGSSKDEDDFDPEESNSGFLSFYREEDGRIATPANECATNTARYKHSKIVNLPRPTSPKGVEIRSLFIAQKGRALVDYDASSLEQRGAAILVYKYPNGVIEGERYLAEKPNDQHCYDQDTEILTEVGWKKFNDLQDCKVAQWDNGEISFVKPLEVIWQKYNGSMITLQNKNIDMKVTPNHRCYYYNEDASDIGRVRIDTAENIYNFQKAGIRIPLAGNLVDGISLPKYLVQLMVATQADGHLAKDCSAIAFSFVREDKVSRLKDILELNNIKYSTGRHFRRGRYEYSIRLNASETTLKIREWLEANKDFKWELIKLDEEGRRIFVNEISYWDGTTGRSGVILDTSSYQSVEVLQAICILSGIKCTRTEFIKRGSSFSEEYLVNRAYVSTKQRPVTTLNKMGKVFYSGYIGCVSVPSGAIVVRRNRKVFVSGNSLLAKKLGIERSDAKSVSYGIQYGCQPPKIVSMLNCSLSRAKEIYEEYWNSNSALAELKVKLEAFWVKTGKKFIIGLDGRKIYTRSSHSLINALTQSLGSLFMKHVFLTVEMLLKQKGYSLSPFEPDNRVLPVIEVHDQAVYDVDAKMLKFKTFDSEEEAKEFVKNWKGGQLSGIGHGKKYYICLPNDVSEAIHEAFKIVTQKFKFPIEMAYEWQTGASWDQTH